MIKINTCHIIPDEPYILNGEEDSSVLDFQPDPSMPLTLADKFRYDLFASMAGSDLVVTGKVQIRAKAECARCGCEFETVISAGKLILHYEKVLEQEVDLTAEIREELLLAIPPYFHCRPDCKGICPGCGADLNTEKCTCPKNKSKKKEEPPPEDSPWSVLDSLKPKKK